MPTKQSVCVKRSDIVLWGLGDNACANRLFAPTGNPLPAHEHVSFVPGNGTRNDGVGSRGTGLAMTMRRPVIARRRTV
jgi:hypothetical protein